MAKQNQKKNGIPNATAAEWPECVPYDETLILEGAVTAHGFILSRHQCHKIDYEGVEHFLAATFGDGAAYAAIEAALRLYEHCMTTRNKAGVPANQSLTEFDRITYLAACRNAGVYLGDAAYIDGDDFSIPTDIDDHFCRCCTGSPWQIADKLVPMLNDLETSGAVKYPPAEGAE
jgi:hypothetical protein